jgi:hypothetical protein
MLIGDWESLRPMAQEHKKATKLSINQYLEIAIKHFRKFDGALISAYEYSCLCHMQTFREDIKT